MDTVGLILIVLAVAGYFLFAKKSPQLKPWLIFTGGVGVGITGAAWYMAFVMLPAL